MASSHCDVEVAQLLGADRTEAIAIDLDLPEGAVAPFSTSRQACDALTRAMRMLGYELSDSGPARPMRASFSRPNRGGVRGPEATGRDYCDAVSRAALLALKSAT